jgi:hypothetical protein
LSASALIFTNVAGLVRGDGTSSGQKIGVNISTRASEILLVAILLVMVGFTRIYYGGADGLMVVWKGSFGYRDTLVNLSDFYNLPRVQAAADHPHVLYQLEEMGLMDPTETVAKPAKKVTAPENVEKTSTTQKTPSGTVNH